MLVRIALVAAGGAVGSVLRYTLSRVFQGDSAGFPVGTFGVNALGCLVVGVIAGLSFERNLVGVNSRLFLITGVCGGFTTFSAFGYETLHLIELGQSGQAALNAGGQLIVGLAAVWLGLTIARWL